MPRLRMLASVLLGCALLSPWLSLAAQQARPYRILISNDDGVRAPGLAAVAQVLQAIGEVIIVAPAENQTGKSQSVNTTEPIVRDDVSLPNGLRAIGLTATPATTVQVAIKNIVTPKPDLVVAGINPGYNLGFSGYLSGTVGAARQAAMEGVPAIAASLAGAGAPRDFTVAAEAVLAVARRVKEHGLPAYAFLNVNVPPLPAGGYKGYRITTQARTRAGVETFAQTTHPGTGRTIDRSLYTEGATGPQGTDVWAVENGFVSVTPMRVGEDDSSLADTMTAWFR